MLGSFWVSHSDIWIWWATPEASFTPPAAFTACTCALAASKSSGRVSRVLFLIPVSMILIGGPDVAVVADDALLDEPAVFLLLLPHPAAISPAVITTAAK